MKVNRQCRKSGRSWRGQRPGQRWGSSGGQTELPERLPHKEEMRKKGGSRGGSPEGAKPVPEMDSEETCFRMRGWMSETMPREGLEPLWQQER